MFHPMALTVMLALGGALLLALTLMPVLCSFLLRGQIHEGDNFVIRFVKRVYEPTLNVALRLRWLVVAGAIVLFAGSLWLFTGSARSSCRSSTKAPSLPCSTNPWA